VTRHAGIEDPCAQSDVDHERVRWSVGRSESGPVVAIVAEHAPYAASVLPSAQQIDEIRAWLHGIPVPAETRSSVRAG